MLIQRKVKPLKGVSYMYTKLPTLTTFVRDVMWACIMQSRDYMYIQVLVLLVGSYRDQMCICIVRNALMCIRLGSTIFGQ